MRFSKFLYGVCFGLVVGGCSSAESVSMESTPESVLESEEAIRNGASVSGNSLVVHLQVWSDPNDGVFDMFPGEPWNPVRCSGLVIAKDTILSAAHCFRMNTPADRIWTTAGMYVRIARKASTSGPWSYMVNVGDHLEWRSDGVGDWQYTWATVRIHSGYTGFAPPGEGLRDWETTSHNDVATVQFVHAPIPGFDSVSQMPYLAAGLTRTYSGTMRGYGLSAPPADPNAPDLSDLNLRAGVMIGTYPVKSMHRFNTSKSDAHGCPGDSGAPVNAISIPNVPNHYFAMNSYGDCVNGPSFGVSIQDKISFITGALAGRCTTTTFTAGTPPPQAQYQLRRCF